MCKFGALGAKVDLSLKVKVKIKVTIAPIICSPSSSVKF